MVSLIKPQFEAGREHVGKGGIVRDIAVHRDVIRRVVDGIAKMAVAAGAHVFPDKGPTAISNICCTAVKTNRVTTISPMTSSKILSVNLMKCR